MRPQQHNLALMMSLKKFHVPIVITLLMVMQSAAPQPTSSDFERFSQWFVEKYQSLNIPATGLSYSANLNQVPENDLLQQQSGFFEEAENRLDKIHLEHLPRHHQIDYLVAVFEIRLNLERLRLSQALLEGRPAADHRDGLFHVANGKQWYAYFLKRWLGAEVSPDELYQFGMQQIERAKQNIDQIQAASGLSKSAFQEQLGDDQFFSTDQASIQKNFERIDEIVHQHLSSQFADYQNVPTIRIARGNNPTLSQVPGYYDSQPGTFYYNLFDTPYNRRESDWLYLHEAVPGHHFQNYVSRGRTRPPIRQLTRYYGFIEGWAAYVEELGKELGLYQDDYAHLGKWEWDVVRSVRVPLDIGINFYGWTDEQSLEFWKKHISQRDDIGRREIQRMRRWPAQVITYKYGADLILQWKAQLSKQASFDVRQFHDLLLTNGPLPLDVLGKLVHDNSQTE